LTEKCRKNINNNIDAYDAVGQFIFFNALQHLN